MNWQWLAGSQEVSYKHFGDGFDPHIANQTSEQLRLATSNIFEATGWSQVKRVQCLSRTHAERRQSATENFFAKGRAVNDKIGRQALSQLPSNPSSIVSPRMNKINQGNV